MIGAKEGSIFYHRAFDLNHDGIEDPMEQYMEYMCWEEEMTEEENNKDESLYDSDEEDSEEDDF